MGEIEIEETLEESVVDFEENLLVSRTIEKPFSVVAMLDTSSSMAGEKHLLASIAVAVLLLKVRSEHQGLVVFSSKAKTIKTMGVAKSIESTVLEFLKTKSRGFTNIAEGLQEGYLQTLRGRTPKTMGLLVSDGRATEGKEPIPFARKFDSLSVIHLHGPGSYLEGSKAMSEAGRGLCVEVEELFELPRAMYEALRWMSRLC